MTSRTLLLACLVPLTAACGGDTDAGSSAQPTVVDLEDPTAPFMTIGEDGTVVVFRADPTTGAPTGLTVMMADGRTGELGIDPDTGYPAYWTSEGHVVVFSNVRPAEGLADVGVITPDGSAAEQLDVAFPAIHPPPAPATFAMAVRTPEEQRAKFNQLVAALDTTISITACVGGAIITGGTAVAGVAVPPAGVPLFTATAGATAAACASAFVKFMALDPNNARFVAISDTLGAVGLPASIVECLAKPGVLQCLKSTADVASFAASGLVRAVSATFLRLRDGVARDVPYQVYCCNGPTQVATNDMEQWRAAVVEGLATTPFTYMFDPGDGEPATWLNSTEYGLSFSHRYGEAGTYTLGVSVRDGAGNQVASNATVSGPLTSFQVRVYEPLSAVDCCTFFSGDITATGFYAGDEIVARFDVADGRRPYTYSVDFGDGKAPDTGTLAADFTHVTHVFAQPGSYEVTVTVTDDDGDTVASVPTSVVIKAPPLEPDCYDACYHLCTNIWGQSCSTGTMANAKQKVSVACGSSFSATFARNAETYCSTSLGWSGNPDAHTFTVDGCVEASAPAP